jgi:hypothetical protein
MSKKDAIFIYLFLFVILVGGVWYAERGVKASPEFNHPKMTCDFIYYHDDEQDIIRRCYDEQKDNICYVLEDFKAISCVPNHTGPGPIGANQ